MKKTNDNKKSSVQIYSLRDAMNKIFNESVWDPFSSSSSNYLGDWGSEYPKVNIKENKDLLKIEAELPGMEAKDVNVEVDDDYMIISGKQNKEEKKEDENVYREERYWGEFRREFSLPTMVDSSKIKAKMKDGVLRIELPKSKKSKSKRIQIEKE